MQLSRNALIKFIFFGSVIGVYSFFYFLGFSKLVDSTIFSQLAEGFAQGHTYFLDKPSPELLQLPDPYDPIANASVRKHDMAFFNGHFYTYYGPLNGVLLWLLHTIHLPYLTDNMLSYLWACSLAIVLAYFFIFFSKPLLISQLFGRPLSNHYKIPLKLLLLGYLLTTLNSGVLICLASPSFYEAAQLAASFFFWLGIVLFLYAFPILRNEPARKKASLLIIFSGFSLACCVLSRSSFAPGVCLVSFLFASLLIYLYQIKIFSFKVLSARLFCLSFPLFLGLLTYFTYNYVRFNSIWETGFRYAMPGFNMRELALQHILFNSFNVPANVFNYFLRSPAFEIPVLNFPFVGYPSSVLPDWASSGHYYHGMAIGIVWYMWPLMVIFVSFIKILFNKLTGPSFFKRSSSPFLHQSSYKEFFHLGAIFFIIFWGLITTLLFLCWSEVRYIQDFIVALSIFIWFFCLATLNYYEQHFSKVWVRIHRFLIYSTCIISIFIAISLAFTPHFREANPLLMNRLDKYATFSIQKIPIFLQGEVPIHFVKVKASSEENQMARAENLLTEPRQNKYWASKGGESTKIEFLFNKAYPLTRIVLTARGAGGAINEFWEYYRFLGYKNNQLIFNEYRKAFYPVRISKQYFKFSPKLIDRLVIQGERPVQKMKDGTYTSGTNPGFAEVEFFGKHSGHGVNRNSA